jgi:hypothetical protein
MADGYDKGDWTVDLQPSGHAGSVQYGSMRGVFDGVTFADALQIVFVGARPPVGADVSRMYDAARAAIRDAVKRRGREPPKRRSRK